MERYDLKGVNFLVIEDEKHMCIMISNVLHTLGSTNVAQASDGEDAFKQLCTFHADILICDWMMQPMDGLEFTRLIRTAEHSPNPTLPIIMLTAHTEFSKVLEARDAGVTEFLPKPFSAHSLYKRICAVISHPRPFIHCETFDGPDRRYRLNTNWHGENRRHLVEDSSQEMQVAH